MEQIILLAGFVPGVFAGWFLAYLQYRDKEKIVYVDRMILPENILCRTCGTCGAMLPEDVEGDSHGLQ